MDPPFLTENVELFASYAITLSHTLVIHQRNVYSILQFLEDLGGLFGIIYLLGVVLNFLFTTKNTQIYLDRCINQ